MQMFPFVTTNCTHNFSEPDCVFNHRVDLESANFVLQLLASCSLLLQQTFTEGWRDTAGTSGVFLGLFRVCFCVCVCACRGVCMCVCLNLLFLSSFQSVCEPTAARSARLLCLQEKTCLMCEADRHLRT